MKLRALIGFLLLTAVPVACNHNDSDPYDNGNRLYITLEMPASAAVKSETDGKVVPATATENAVHDLKIWVFENGKDANEQDTHTYLNSLIIPVGSDASEFPQPGSAKRYALEVSKEFAKKRPRPTVDVFVMANSASVNLSLDEDSSWQELMDATFGGTGYFGPDGVTVRKQTVPEGGLPMSGYRTLSVSGEEPSLNVATIPLTRAVSKIRFVFSQMETTGVAPEEQEEMRIDKIELNGSLIPVNEYMFTQTPPRVGDTYVAGKMEYTFSDIPIAKTATPEVYAYANQSGQEYEALIQDALSSQKLTALDSTYLRESDKPLTGTIYYTVKKGGVDQPQKTATFQMLYDGNFPRNHTWTVYGYFISKRLLQLSVSVLPWDKTDTNIEFSEQALMVTTKFTVRPETVASITRVGTSNNYLVQMKDRTPAKAYLRVVAPAGGWLIVSPIGDANNSQYYFSVTPSEPISIDPRNNNGEIEITIAPKEIGVGAGKRISIDFQAETNDHERQISGTSEAIDQNYIFVLP